MSATNGVPRRTFESHPLNLVYRVLLFVFVAAVLLLEFPGAREHRTSPDPGINTQNLVVQNIDSGSPNHGSDIRTGDVIHSIEGERIRNLIHYRSVLANHSTQAPQTYTFMRDGDPIEVVVRYKPMDARFRDIALPLVAVFLIIVGLWVYLRRPDALGSLFAAICAMLASFLTLRPSATLPALQLGGEFLDDAIILYFPAVLVHFFLLFPDRIGRDRIQRLRARLTAVYAPPTILYAITAYLAVQRFQLQSVSDLLVTVILSVSAVYFLVYVAVSLITFVRRYRSAVRAQKQKLRVVISGSLAGFMPFAAITIYRSVSPGESSALEPAAALCLAFVPATFAYAILKHGAIELNTVVRKSLVYAVFSGVIIALYYAVVNFLGDVLVVELGVSSAVLVPVAAVVLALIFAPAREHIQKVVDRVFYRGDYVYKQEVIEFNRQLSRKVNKNEIYGHFLERVESLLHASYIAVFSAQEDGTLRLERTTGDPPKLQESFCVDCFLARYFSRFRTPLMVEFLDRSWERPNLDEESRTFLSTPGAAVCVPVIASDRFIGLVLLGEKLSGATYRRADAELLATFAEQLALVLQNVDLVKQSLEQERLKSEVLLASEIQISLLPTQPPYDENLALGGQMVSSLEVGGDYFDYFSIDHDHIGIAIGDVSGKGIPAAMLMSSIQAVFKNLAIKSRLGPADVNRELNEYLCENAKPDQFATFFYGVFERSTATFTFSNAGHCPALLIKRDYADRLGNGGMVLGVRREQQFKEGAVHIEPGDLMMLYTDGVTEQKDNHSEEYGEDRLIDFLRENGNLPLPELQEALVEDIITFGSGRQDDDITTVIARHKTA